LIASGRTERPVARSTNPTAGPALGPVRAGKGSPGRCGRGTTWCRTGSKNCLVGTTTQSEAGATNWRGPSGHQAAYPSLQRQLTQAGAQILPGTHIHPKAGDHAHLP
jgi:hypothetical protein